MKRFVVAILCSVALLIGWGSIRANAQGTAEAHVAAAKAIADSVPKNARNELDYPYILTTICSEPKPTTPAQESQAAQRPANTTARPREEWYVDPVKVFDNLYYHVGSRLECRCEGQRSRGYQAHERYGDH